MWLNILFSFIFFSKSLKYFERTFLPWNSKRNVASVWLWSQERRWNLTAALPLCTLHVRTGTNHPQKEGSAEWSSEYLLNGISVLLVYTGTTSKRCRHLLWRPVRIKSVVGFSVEYITSKQMHWNVFACLSWKLSDQAVSYLQLQGPEKS